MLAGLFCPIPLHECVTGMFESKKLLIHFQQNSSDKSAIHKSLLEKYIICKTKCKNQTPLENSKSFCQFLINCTINFLTRCLWKLESYMFVYYITKEYNFVHDIKLIFYFSPLQDLNILSETNFEFADTRFCLYIKPNLFDLSINVLKHII